MTHICMQVGRDRPTKAIVRLTVLRHIKGRCGTPLRYVSSLAKGAP
jgi:hypothetical protein